ncbi:hypothetical protein U9M48_031641 [Paspalum notatum var. saurae]|uniref:Reverse transcriptase zinc-binding domain-containing protein n=1 Tax=Paspalum notatum var. saurae TaxID=547442 RepID=A0AAQ3U3E4_PASNO
MAWVEVGEKVLGRGFYRPERRRKGGGGMSSTGGSGGRSVCPRKEEDEEQSGGSGGQRTGGAVRWCQHRPVVSAKAAARGEGTGGEAQRGEAPLLLSRGGMRKKAGWAPPVSPVLLAERGNGELGRRGFGPGFPRKSAYNAFFLGSVKFAPWKRIWKSWAPLRCKFFVWLAVKNRCWTGDRLLKHGLPHPSACLLCDQEDETIQHILGACVFSREIWTKILSVGLQFVAPQPNVRVFSAWWCWAVSRVPKEARKGFNSLVILVAWSLWKHRIACVFEGLGPSVSLVCQEVEEESQLWCLAGNKALQGLLGRAQVGCLK